MTKRTVRLDQVRIDGGTQFRKEINQDKVVEYAECMEEGDVFPIISVVFDGSTYWLWDGFHRYLAHKKNKMAQIEVDYTPGTVEDAQDLALGANSDHGLELSNADKRYKVEVTLSMERHKGKSNKEIARLCKVSDKLVASVRDPKAKAKQAQNVKRHYEKKAQDEGSAIESHSDIAIESHPEPKPSILDGNEPSAEELMANELTMQADLQQVNQFLEADDKMAELYADNKRLNHLLAQKEARIASIMREKSECIKLCQKLQKENDKLKGKK